jgi:hypothetical protein
MKEKAMNKLHVINAGKCVPEDCVTVMLVMALTERGGFAARRKHLEFAAHLHAKFGLDDDAAERVMMRARAIFEQGPPAFAALLDKMSKDSGGETIGVDVDVVLPGSEALN